MSNVAQNITERPFARVRRARPRPYPIDGRLLACGVTEGELSDSLAEDALGRKLPPDRRLAQPKIIATLPYAFAARLSDRRWGIYVSCSEVPDVALLAEPPSHIVTSAANATATVAHVSNRQAVVAPLAKSLAELLAAHEGGVPAPAFVEWLRATETWLVGAAARFRAARANIGRGGDITPGWHLDEHALLGQFVRLALRGAE